MALLLSNTTTPTPMCTLNSWMLLHHQWKQILQPRPAHVHNSESHVVQIVIWQPELLESWKLSPCSSDSPDAPRNPVFFSSPLQYLPAICSHGELEYGQGRPGPGHSTARVYKMPAGFRTRGICLNEWSAILQDVQCVSDVPSWCKSSLLSLRVIISLTP